jgi:hypothetical protein
VARGGIVGAVRQDGRVPQDVEPPHSVLIVVGREEFTPPSSFGGSACAATDDCIVVAVRDVEDGPTTLSMSVTAPAALTRLGEFRLLSEGLVGVRDLSFREHEAVGVDSGWATVTVWGDAEQEPSQIVVQVVGA